MSKCQILHINWDQDKLKRWADVSGFKVGSFSSSYLGLPLNGNPRSLFFWNLIFEKIRKRLASCAKGYFSKAGRLILINSMLIDVPIYYLTLVQAPSLVCKSLEKFMRDFLQKGVDKRKGSHLVSWEVLRHLVNQEGLEIGQLRLRN